MKINCFFKHYQLDKNQLLKIFRRNCVQQISYLFHPIFFTNFVVLINNIHTFSTTFYISENLFWNLKIRWLSWLIRYVCIFILKNYIIYRIFHNVRRAVIHYNNLTVKIFLFLFSCSNWIIYKISNVYWFIVVLTKLRTQSWELCATLEESHILIGIFRLIYLSILFSTNKPRFRIF